MITFFRDRCRKYKLKKILKQNASYISISESAILMPSVSFDFRTKRTGKSIEIGNNSMIGCNFVFESNQGYIKIGERTFINSGTSLISHDKIEIGSDVIISWGCYIYDHNSHSLDWRERIKDIDNLRDEITTNSELSLKNWGTVKSAPIKICDKVWIGFEAIILKGVTIGEGAIVGARAVVTKDVAPYTVVAGNPATVMKNIEHLR